MMTTETVSEFEYHGKPIRFFLPERETDHIQKYIARTGEFYELTMLEHLASLVRPGDVVLDVGANIGNHTLFLAAVCKAQVVAFEPSPRCRTLLERNLELNGLRNDVVLHACGLGRTDGQLALDESLAMGNWGATRLEEISNDAAGKDIVQVRALDGVEVPGPPRVIKIDVEGMEADVLAGASDLLRDHTPHLYVECADSASLARVLDKLLPLGYRPITQFNATPTVLFTHESHCADAAAVASAYGRLAMGREFGRVREREKYLMKDVKALGVAVGDGKKQRDELEKRLARLEATLASLSDDVQALHAALEESRAQIGPGVSKLSSAAEMLENGQRTLLASVSEHGTRLSRVESNLFGLMAMLRVRQKAPTSPKAPVKPVVAATQSRDLRAARVKRKLKKLQRDPEGFVRDIKNARLRAVATVALDRWK